MECQTGDIRWIDHSGLDEVAELTSLCVEAEVLILRFAHASYNQRAFVPGVLGNLANGFFERTLYDVHPNGFIVVEFELLQGRQAAQESSAPARDNAFLHCRTSGVPGVLAASPFRLPLCFGCRAPPCY